MLDEKAVRTALLDGDVLTVQRSESGAVVSCRIASASDFVPMKLFDAYHAAGWLRARAGAISFGLSDSGRLAWVSDPGHVFG